MHPPRSRSGQASAEYVAVLAVLAAVLAGAGAAVAAPGLPAALVRHMKVALCVVGGDVCRASDARAAGLEPCVVAADGRERSWSAGVVLRTRRGHAFSIERRSDGTVLVQAADDREAGVEGGGRLRLGPWLGIGGGGTAMARFQSGEAWELPDMAAARRLLARISDAYDLSDDGDRTFYGVPRPTVRFSGGGRDLEASVDAELGGDRTGGSLAGTGVRLRHLFGRRRGPDGDTLFVRFDGGASGPLADALPELGSGGAWVGEWRRSRPPVMTIRRLSAGARRGEVVETVAAAALTDPADAAAARRFLFAQVEPALAWVLARRLAARVQAAGSVQRLTYAEEREEGGFDATVLGVGIEHARSSYRRRLVDAEVIAGPRAGARRADCVAAGG